MEDKICSPEKYWMKNLYNKNISYLTGKNISYWIQIYLNGIKIILVSNEFLVWQDFSNHKRASDFYWFFQNLILCMSNLIKKWSQDMFWKKIFKLYTAVFLKCIMVLVCHVEYKC